MRLIITLFFASIILSSTAKADDYSLKPDKVKHFLVSGAIYTGSYAIMHGIGCSKLESTLFGIFVAGTIGFTKEYMDMMSRRDSHIDGGDMLWNGLGIATGVIGTTFVFRF